MSTYADPAVDTSDFIDLGETRTGLTVALRYTTHPDHPERDDLAFWDVISYALTRDGQYLDWVLEYREKTRKAAEGKARRYLARYGI